MMCTYHLLKMGSPKRETNFVTQKIVQIKKQAEEPAGSRSGEIMPEFLCLNREKPAGSRSGEIMAEFLCLNREEPAGSTVDLGR